MIYPTSRSAILTATGAPLAVVLAAWVPELWAVGIAWSGAILLLTLIDGLLSSPIRDYALYAPASSELGSPLEVGVSAQFSGVSAPSQVQASLACNAELVAGGRSETVLGTEGSSLELTGDFVIEPLRRGQLHLEEIWLRWTGPLGLCWRQVHRKTDEIVAILPDISAIRAPALQVFMRDAVFGLLARKIRGEGSEFEALADFQPGMDKRAIDWKGSARHSKLLAKEYDTERNNQIVFVLDSGSAMCEPVAGRPRIDRAVSAALLTAYVALKAGDKARLFSFAARPERATPFVSGSRNFHRLQHEAAAIDYHHQESNYTLALSTLASQLQRRSMIVVFSDFADTTSAELMLESVGRLIDRHLLLFVVIEDEDLLEIMDRPPENSDMVAQSVTAAGLLAQRRLVITRLKHLGVQVLEARHQEIGTRLMNAYLQIKRRGKL